MSFPETGLHFSMKSVKSLRIDTYPCISYCSLSLSLPLSPPPSLSKSMLSNVLNASIFVARDCLLVLLVEFVLSPQTHHSLYVHLYRGVWYVWSLRALIVINSLSLSLSLSLSPIPPSPTIHPTFFPARVMFR